VIRNRVRRRLREIVRHLLTRVPPGYDLVITARNATALAESGTLREAVIDLLGRARLLRDEASA
jgi:ribonuclease P protein component